MNSNKSLLFLGLLMILQIGSIAQDKTVSGYVYDASSKEALSYATISIPNTLSGTVTDDAGYFNIKVKEGSDSIQVSYIGYVDQWLLIDGKNKDLKIYLSPFEYELTEVVVRPKSARYYVEQAVLHYPNCITKSPFNAEAFFIERTSLTNDISNSYQMDKAIFNIYFPNYSDKEIDNQHQLVLHEFIEEGEAKSILMDSKRAKKRIAKQKKKNEKRREKGKDVEEINEDDGPVSISLNDAGAGGPGMSLDLIQTILEEPFLDPEYFDKFTYSFGNNSFYQGKQLMAIDFFNKKKVEHTFAKGTLFLDIEDLSIVAITYNMRVKLPFYINALVKTVAGFKINSISSDVEIKNQQASDLWYPKEVIADIKLQLEQDKRIEDITIKQMLNIYQINIENAAPIPEEMLFESGEEMEAQINNPDGLKWEDVKIATDH